MDVVLVDLGEKEFDLNPGWYKFDKYKNTL